MLLHFCWDTSAAMSSTYFQLSLSLSQLFFFLLIFLTYCYTFSNIFPSFLPFHFPTTNYLISLFFYPFNFLYFWLFLFSSSYYKFPILSHIRCIVFSHIKCCFSQFFFFIFWWSLSPIIGCAREIMVHSQSFVIMVQCIRSFFYFLFFIYFLFLSLIFVWSSFASNHIIEFMFVISANLM